MSDLQAAYSAPSQGSATVDNIHKWENKENPQGYDLFWQQHTHAKPSRHMLGVVGGNEVSPIKGNLVDLESDLRGITRLNTFCPSRQYQPPAASQTTIQRQNVKGAVSIDVSKEHLKPGQMWAYPAVYAPEPIVKETCGRPEKY
jgi:hypothetical protein